MLQALTLLEVESRFNLGQYLDYNIKQEHVIRLFNKIIVDFEIPIKFIVNKDIGNQFIANEAQDYLKQNVEYKKFT